MKIERKKKEKETRSLFLPVILFLVVFNFRPKNQKLKKLRIKFVESRARESGLEREKETVSFLRRERARLWLRGGDKCLSARVSIFKELQLPFFWWIYL